MVVSTKCINVMKSKEGKVCIDEMLCQMCIVVFGMMSCFLNNRKHLVGDTPNDQSAVAIATQ